MPKRLLIGFLLILLMLTGCRTYYQRQQEFHEHFRSGQMEQAARVLQQDTRSAKNRNRLLHLLNQGVVHHMLQDYQASNQFFEEAFILGEDFRRDYLDEALALVTNPNVTEYRGEHFELLMVHYFKAMNFIHLGDFDAALVECRRMNIKLAALADRYQSNNRYRRDAFVHNLMGIIYDAAGDHNNAFIAYRNALEIYQEDFSSLFGVQVPGQLKLDLIRTAYLTGFGDQGRYYEELFGITYDPSRDARQGQLVFFWQNGLGPVKEEWSINFMLVRGAGGVVQFVNEDMGLSFPFPVSERASGDLGDLRVVRVAFPRFSERRPVYSSARLNAAGQTKPLFLAQDINAIAFKSLEDRMMREMGSALLRLAVKQAAEQSLRRQNESLGAILGLLGAATEQADTRNWQTLPYAIHYTRMELPEGSHDLSLELLLPNGNLARTLPLQAEIRSGRTTFLNFHTLDSRRPGAR
jgi:uncharacterized protein